jgi:AraC family transcriptional regulator
MKTTTRETYAKRIERVLDLLAADTDHTLDIYRLAEEAYLSPYHFHRVYVAMMGETVNDTIRRKRLHQSAVWLKSECCCYCVACEVRERTSLHPRIS